MRRLRVVYPTFFMILLILNYVPAYAAITIVFQDDFNVESDMRLRWTECMDVSDAYVNVTQDYAYSGSWGFKFDRKAVASGFYESTMQADFYADTGTTDYHFIGYFYDWTYSGAARRTGIGLLSQKDTACMDDSGSQNNMLYSGWIGYDSTEDAGNYIYWQENVTQGASVSTTIANSTGWHMVEWLITANTSSYDRIRAYLDGEYLYETTVPIGTSYGIVMLGPTEDADDNYFDYMMVTAGSAPDTTTYGLDSGFGNVPDDYGGLTNTNSTSDWNLDIPATYFITSLVSAYSDRRSSTVENISVQLGADYDGDMYLALYATSSQDGYRNKAVSGANPLWLVRYEKFIRPDSGQWNITDIGYTALIGQTLAIAVSGSVTGLVINDTLLGDFNLFNSSGIIPNKIGSFGLVDGSSTVALWGYQSYKLTEVGETESDMAGAVLDGGLMALFVLGRDATGMGEVGGGMMVSAILIIGTVLALGSAAKRNQFDLPPLALIIIVLVEVFAMSSINFLPAYVPIVIFIVAAGIAAGVIVNGGKGGASG